MDAIKLGILQDKCKTALEDIDVLKDDVQGLRESLQFAITTRDDRIDTLEEKLAHAVRKIKVLNPLSALKPKGAKMDMTSEQFYKIADRDQNTILDMKRMIGEQEQTINNLRQKLKGKKNGQSNMGSK